MNRFKPSRFLSSILSGVTGVLTLGFAVPLFAQIPETPVPAGDLTVTVNELANGDVQFSLSGTAYMQGNFEGMVSTNFVFGNPGTPPSAGPMGQFPLPEGLKLTVPSNNQGSAPEGPSEVLPLPGPTTDLPISFITFTTGGWFLGNFSSGPLFVNDPVVGSGKVVTDSVPFSHFVPGTFLVQPGKLRLMLENSVEEGVSEFEQAQYPYFITYKVIPYAAGLDVEAPKRFRNTKVGRSSRTQRLTITNLGSLPITGLEVQISPEGEKNFKVTQPAETTLGAGASTTFRATFEPTEEGQRRAIVTITDGTQSKNITLKGKGIDGNPNSPRFPGGPGN